VRGVGQDCSAATAHHRPGTDHHGQPPPQPGPWTGGRTAGTRATATTVCDCADGPHHRARRPRPGTRPRLRPARATVPGPSRPSRSSGRTADVTAVSRCVPIGVRAGDSTTKPADRDRQRQSHGGRCLHAWAASRRRLTADRSTGHAPTGGQGEGLGSGPARTLTSARGARPGPRTDGARRRVGFASTARTARVRGWCSPGDAPDTARRSAATPCRGDGSPGPGRRGRAHRGAARDRVPTGGTTDGGVTNRGRSTAPARPVARRRSPVAPTRLRRLRRAGTGPVGGATWPTRPPGPGRSAAVPRRCGPTRRARTGRPSWASHRGSRSSPRRRPPSGASPRALHPAHPQRSRGGLPAQVHHAGPVGRAVFAGRAQYVASCRHGLRAGAPATSSRWSSEGTGQSPTVTRQRAPGVLNHFLHLHNRSERTHAANKPTRSTEADPRQADVRSVPPGHTLWPGQLTVRVSGVPQSGVRQARAGEAVMGVASTA
jgi:hypothetical protein